jgi:hypothetical protein
MANKQVEFQIYVTESEKWEELREDPGLLGML